MSKEQRKVCPRCQTFNQETSAFCTNCGYLFEQDNSKKNTKTTLTPNEIRPQKEPKAKTDFKSGTQENRESSIIKYAIVGIIVVLVVVIGVIISKKVDFNSYNEDDVIYSEDDYNEDDYNEDYQEDFQYEDDSYFRVGETYTVQTNLRVREGPGKEYRILSRNELTSEDYAKSVNSNTTTDALIEKGKTVTCQEMSGDWMMISSGWICVYDEGEELVK